MSRNKIQGIAAKAREELYPLMRQIHNNVNLPKHLAGACGYGSVMLWDALKEAGFEPEIYQGCGHWFVVCNGYLVDITATQFGQAKVVVKSYEKVRQMIESTEYQLTFWTSANAYKTPCDANLCNMRKQLNDARKALETNKECAVCAS